MINVQRGFRDKREKYVNLNQSLSVEMQVNGRAIYDYCCFGVDAANQLSDDRYMVFYNQTRSPAGEVTYTNNGGIARFEIRLSQLPDTIRKLVFTVSIDGNGTMGDIVSHTLRIGQNGQNAVEMQLSGRDFHSEKAIISIEIYRKPLYHQPQSRRITKRQRRICLPLNSARIIHPFPHRLISIPCCHL